MIEGILSNVTMFKYPRFDAPCLGYFHIKGHIVTYVRKLPRVYLKKTKVCITCKEDLPLKNFHKDRIKPTGHRKSCRQCVNVRKRSSKQDHYICFTCKTEKHVSLYYKDSAKPSGHDGSCIECKRIKQGRTRRNNVGGRQCTNCQKTKYLYEFPNKKYLKGYHQEHLDMCKSCYYVQDIIPKGLKKCSRCRNVKGLASFCRTTRYRDGLAICCRECAREKYKAVRDRRSQRATSMWANYKMTLQDYDNLLANQNGLCAFNGCDTTEELNGGFLAIDHDHNCCEKKSCGKCVRGLLCSAHNSMLGFAHDRIKELLAGVDYLESHN